MSFLTIIEIIIILQNYIYKLMVIPFIPYRLYVISVSNKILQEDEKSETWQFYEAAQGVAFYGSFPAIINSPAPSAIVTPFLIQP